MEYVGRGTNSSDLENSGACVFLTSLNNVVRGDFELEGTEFADNTLDCQRNSYHLIFLYKIKFCIHYLLVNGFVVGAVWCYTTSLYLSLLCQYFL